MSVDPKHQITTGHVFIGIFGTISLFMVNTVKNSHVSSCTIFYHCMLYRQIFFQISEDNTSESGARIAKIWLLIGFVMGFASIIAAIWVMIDDFINNRKYMQELDIDIYAYMHFCVFLYSQKGFRTWSGFTYAKSIDLAIQSYIQIWPR